MKVKQEIVAKKLDRAAELAVQHKGKKIGEVFKAVNEALVVEFGHGLSNTVFSKVFHAANGTVAKTRQRKPKGPVEAVESVPTETLETSDRPDRPAEQLEIKECCDVPTDPERDAATAERDALKAAVKANQLTDEGLL